jgi:hypothetical protein
LALDHARRWLFVACGAGGAVTLDGAHDGQRLGKLTTGGGVDNIDYDPARRLLYVAAGAEAKLTVARVGDDGGLTAVATAPTGPGARVVVIGPGGAAYVADSGKGVLWRVVVPNPQ